MGSLQIATDRGELRETHAQLEALKALLADLTNSCAHRLSTRQLKQGSHVERTIGSTWVGWLRSQGKQQVDFLQ